MNKTLNKELDGYRIPEPRRISAQEIAALFQTEVNQINRLFDQRAFPTEMPEGQTERVADLLQVYKYFESSKAGALRSKLRDVSIGALTDFHELACLDAVNSAIVERYAEELASGETLPPVIAFENGDGKYLVVDGRHRIEAAKLAGRTNMLCKVRRGTPHHQAVCAIAANNANGRGKSHNEKIVGLKNVLEYYKNLGLEQPSTRRLGKLVGVSHVAVQKMLNKLNPNREDTPAKTKKSPRAKTLKPCPIAQLGIVGPDLATFPGLRRTIPLLSEKLDAHPARVASAFRKVAECIDVIAKDTKDREKTP